MYEESNRPEMALKFYDRISKTYRKEGWSVILASLLVAMKRCAKKVGFLDVAIECLVEMLHVELTPRYEQRLSVLQELLGIVDGKIVSETGSWTFGKRGLGRQASLGPSTSSSSTASMMLAATLNNTAAVCSPFEASSSSSNFPGTPSSKNNAVTVSPSFVAIDMDQINSFLVCAVQFEKASTYVGAPVRFQVTIEAVGDQTPPASLRIARVEIIFSDPDYDHCITDKTAVAHSEADFSDHEIIMGKGGSLQWIDCTNCAKSDNLIGSNAGSSGGSGSKSFWTKAVNLELRPGLTNIFEGVVNPTCGMDLKIVNVSAVVESVGGMFTLDFRVSERPENTIKKRKWLEITQGTAKKIRKGWVSCISAHDPVNLGLPKFILKDGFGELTSLR